MKKSNVLFIALTGASVVLIGAIMTDNITSVPAQPAALTAAAMTQGPENARNTEEVRQKFKQMGLQLHEGKYWKETHE
jgi:ABC-type protease/lipase transport system fused ATPase/permease subunit